MRATAGGFFQRPQRPPRGGSRFDDDKGVGGGGGGVTVMVSKQAVDAKLRAGRASGVYNLACLELTTVPPAAVDPWNPAHLRPGENDKAWEVVEPTKVRVLCVCMCLCVYVVVDRWKLNPTTTTTPTNQQLQQINRWI